MNTNKWILIILGLIIATISVIGFFEIDTSAVVNEKILPDLPISKFIIFLLACLIMPIIEEYSFRYWILAKGWKKYLSLFALLGFVLSTTNLVLIAVFVLVVAYILLAKASLPLRVIASSIFFSLLHLNIGANLSFFTFFLFFMLGGVLLCLLYIKKGIWLPIIIHMSYNSFLILILSNAYFGFKDKTEEYHINQTKCTLINHSIFYANTSSRYTRGKDSLMMKGYNKARAVTSILEKQDGYKYDIEPSLDKISISIIGNSATEQQQIIAKALHLQFDTSQTKKEDTYQILYRPNAAQLAASLQSKKKGDFTYRGPVLGLAESLTDDYGVLCESTDTNTVFLTLPYDTDVNHYMQQLESKFGFKFIKKAKDIKTIQVSFGK
jgi:membrane protease YdiL (CAAX protease family)